MRQRKSGFIVISIITTLLLSFTTNAQTFEAGAFGGAAYYLGDLNPKKHFTESDIAYGGVIKYNFNQRLGLGFTITQANIKSDATPASPLSIQINEFALMAEVNFFPYAINDRKNRWTPYIFGGGAVFVSDNTNSLFSLPFGIGLKTSPFKNVGLNLFWSARKTFTDDLDNVISIDYQGYNGDWYIFYGLNLTFAIRLNKDNSCRNIISMNSY
jgi:hypothetical protein